MGEFSIGRRTMLRAVAGAGAVAAFPSAEAAADAADATDPTTRATYRAVVDAVIPETPEVADELGEEHRPGGLEVGLDAYLVEFVNVLFSAWDAPHPAVEADVEVSAEAPGVGDVDLSTDASFRQGEEANLRLAEVVAKVCDVAATELLVRAENESTPDPTRFEGGGPFASLARKDRLRALALLDEKELDTADLPGPVLEGSAGLIPQLVVAFTQVVYYSEWEGYEDISAPPGERGFSETVEDDQKLQSWRQTDFPGVIDGAAAFRGYWGTGEGPLGEYYGKDDQPVPGVSYDSPNLFPNPGAFEDDYDPTADHDTSDYEEPYDTSGDPADGFLGQGSSIQRPEEALEEAREGLDEGLLERATERFFGNGTETGGLGGGR